jgi:hypothetical protein
MPSNGSGASVRLKYTKLRDVSTKDEDGNDSATYVVIMPATEILKIGTDGNLRKYIPAHPGKKRNSVHKQIGATIRKDPDRFSQLNSGFLIGAARVKVDDQVKTITLWEASVNNGAQSQGEIEFYMRQCEELGEEPNEFDIRAEISVEPDSGWRSEIAIARNTATKIADISRAGRRGYFDALNEAFRKDHPDLELAKSETDIGEKFVNTRALIQILRAMMPRELAPSSSSSEGRMRAYKNAALCLADFQDTVDEAEPDDGSRPNPDQILRYKYYLDMAGQAWSTYLHWQVNPAWKGLYLRTDVKQVERENGQIVKVADGLLFPVLAALSSFVKRDRRTKRWILKMPEIFKDEDLTQAAERLLRATGSKPMLMGRSANAYESLMLLTEMANRYDNAE